MLTVAKPSMTGLIAALEGEEPETNILRVLLRNRANPAKRFGGKNVVFPARKSKTSPIP
jgi:hypothetical protein